jgi:hypothetical protein
VPIFEIVAYLSGATLQKLRSYARRKGRHGKPGAKREVCFMRTANLLVAAASAVLMAIGAAPAWAADLSIE